MLIYLAYFFLTFILTRFVSGAFIVWVEVKISNKLLIFYIKASFRLNQISAKLPCSNDYS